MSNQAPQYEGEIERFEFSQEADEAAEVTPNGPWVRFEDHNTALFKAEADVVAAESERDELLRVIEPFTVDGGVSCGDEEVDALYAAFERIKEER